MPAAGDLLIAHPTLPENNPFFRSVIYVYHHSNHGTSGIILNKSLGWPIEEVCEDKGIAFDLVCDHKLHWGGPVHNSNLIMLHSDEWQTHNTRLGGKGYYVSSDDQMLERIGFGDCPAYWRLFVGISSWAPGQLDLELGGHFPYTTQHRWLTAKANDNLLFEIDEDVQYEKALEASASQMFDKFL